MMLMLGFLRHKQGKTWYWCLPPTSPPTLALWHSISLMGTASGEHDFPCMHTPARRQINPLWLRCAPFAQRSRTRLTADIAGQNSTWERSFWLALRPARACAVSTHARRRSAERPLLVPVVTDWARLTEKKGVTRRKKVTYCSGGASSLACKEMEAACDAASYESA